MWKRKGLTWVQYSDIQLLSFKASGDWWRMKQQGKTNVKEPVWRSDKVLSARLDDHVWKVLEVSKCASHTSTPYMFATANLTTCRKTGGGNSVSLFFFFSKQMTPWQLEKMLGSLNRFLSYKNKMCWIRQRQTFYILLLNPNESTDKCHPTPTPSVPWLLFFFPSLSRQKCHIVRRW